MPLHIDAADIKPGDIYEDPFCHPCLCVKLENGEVIGISLVDGTYPRTPDIGISDVRSLTLQEAWHWRRFGPKGTVVPVEHRWWYKR